MQISLRFDVLLVNRVNRLLSHLLLYLRHPYTNNHRCRHRLFNDCCVGGSDEKWENWKEGGNRTSTFPSHYSMISNNDRPQNGGKRRRLRGWWWYHKVCLAEIFTFLWCRGCPGNEGPCWKYKNEEPRRPWLSFLHLNWRSGNFKNHFIPVFSLIPLLPSSSTVLFTFWSLSQEDTLSL